MAQLKHAFTSEKAEGGDATLVRPSNWNADHVGIALVRKTADESVTNSTTPQDDDQLLFAIAANEQWIFELWLAVAGNVTGDITVSMVGPAGSTVLWDAMGSPASETTGNTVAQGRVQASGAAIGFGTVDTYMVQVYIKGTVVNGATPGSLKLQWAQGTSQAVATIVKANSWLKAFRVA